MLVSLSGATHPEERHMAMSRRMRMGFQTADVQPLAEDIVTLPGVSGVWILPGPEDRSSTMWVAVEGLDEKGHTRRMKVRDTIEQFITARQVEMGLSGYLFDYHVTVDEPALGPLQVPKAALRNASTV
jgi:hypothetical protein